MIQSVIGQLIGTATYYTAGSRYRRISIASLATHRRTGYLLRVTSPPRFQRHSHYPTTRFFKVRNPLHRKRFTIRTHILKGRYFWVTYRSMLLLASASI